MAIDLETQFPGAAKSGDASYPHGSTQNKSLAAGVVGTPQHKDLFNDMWGFLWAMLEAAGVDPSGDPDTALVSQYLEALIGCQQVTDVEIIDHSFTWNTQPFTGADGLGNNQLYLAGGNNSFLLEPGFYQLFLSNHTFDTGGATNIQGTANLFVCEAQGDNTINQPALWEESADVVFPAAQIVTSTAPMLDYVLPVTINQHTEPVRPFYFQLTEQKTIYYVPKAGRQADGAATLPGWKINATLIKFG